MRVYALLIAAAVCAQYVYAPGCNRDGIGAWLERNALPLIVSHHCVGIEPLYKDCDWRGHYNRSYAELFGLRTRSPTEIERLLAGKRRVRIALNYTAPWRPQVEALVCAQYADSVAEISGLPAYGRFKFEFNDWMRLRMRPLPGIRQVLVMKPPRCRLRIGVHFRAGDVFQSLDGADVRTAPLQFIEAQLRKLAACVAAAGGQPSNINVLTELSPETAAVLADRLPGSNVLFSASDELVHLALAARSDVLVLGFSAFSWIMALVNAEPLIVVYQRGVHKFRGFAHVTTDLGLNDSFCETVVRPLLRARCHQ